MNQSYTIFVPKFIEVAMTSSLCKQNMFTVI